MKAKITEEANYFSDYIAFSAIEALTLQGGQVLYNQLLMNPPGRERSKGN